MTEPEPTPEPTPDGSRRLFGPVVLLGLAGAGAVAVGGHRAMLEVPGSFLQSAGLLSYEGNENAQVQFPLAGALGLVGLAAWGALLVSRGIVRRIVAALAALAGAGATAVVVVGGFVQDDDAAADLATRLGLGAVTIEVDRTPWVWVALAGGLVTLAAGVLAVRHVGRWPEMGSRYDAPTGGGATAPVADGADGEQSNLDLWKAMDEGADPTDD
ncbi:Trp biosynthesis-associated membrane protein [Nocardioides caeni]|uniref:Trp biosynthesis-associated membrane protein n=1 Tax=Nocardioides caeni TaxID=574700 RepID=UPI001305397B|nr:Trp biosynthesis-associated membrane protein [Nocardioides caeni]